MNSKVLLMIVHQPLTKHNFIRLGVNTKYKNWKIIYWSILPFINKKIYIDFTKEGSRHLKNKNYKEISSLMELIKEKKKLPKNFFYSNSAGNYLIASIIDRILYISGGKKISLEYNTELDIDIFTIGNFIEYFRKNSFLRILRRAPYMISKKFLEYLSNKIGSTPSSLSFVFNNNVYQKIKKKNQKTSIIKVDSPELELFLKAKKRRKKITSNIVFIDDVVEGSFDDKLGYAQDRYRRSSDYWGPTGNLLNHIKNYFPNYKILIAAHHRRNENDIPIKNYKFYFDQTSELIKNTKLVLCHNSFACQIAVLFKKPIIFLTSDYYQKYHHHSHVLTIELSKALGTQLIHIGKNFEKNSSVIKKIKQAKINTSKYEEYRKKYIQFDSKIHGRWKNILKNLDSNKSLIL